MNRKMLLFLLCIAPIPLALWQLYFQPNADQFWSIVSTFLGAAAYSTMCIILLLGARPKGIDYYDAQIVHRIAAVGSLALILLHNQAEGLAHNGPGTHAAAQYGGNAQTIFLILAGISVLLLATKWMMYLPPRLQQIIQPVRRLFRYDYIKWIHHLNLVAIVLMVLHIVYMNIAWHTPIGMSLFLVYFGIPAAVYIAFLYNRFASGHTSVQSIESISDYMVEMSVAKKACPNAQTGNILWVRLGLHEHPFTVTDVTNEAIFFIFERKGTFTKKLANQTPGMPLRVQIQRTRRLTFTQPTIYITGGSGITAAISAIRQWLQQPNEPFYLYASYRHQKEAIYAHYFYSILQKHAHFHYDIFITRENKKRRLTPERLVQNSDLEKAQCIICASDAAAAAFEKMLRDVSVTNIRKEAF